MVTTELGACEWFVWDLRRSNLIDRGQLDQVIGDFLQQQPRSEPAQLAEYLVQQGVISQFQAERLLQGKTQGFVLGPFTLMDSLGVGSMGTVYKALSKTDNSWYAVKVLPRRSMWNVRIARRKVRAFEAVRHPAVVPFVDVGTSGGMHYLAWPFVEGETLEKRVEREGSLSPAKVAEFAFHMAEGMEVCHQQGLFHGLFKPSNVMIGAKDELFILDFGIGCLLAETEGESLVDTMSTANSVASGLDCASPESIMDPTNLTPLGDQYSLGCVMYFCLTGQYPFPDGSAAEKMMAHQFKDPTPIRDLNPEAPVELVDIVKKLMQKSPENRYPVISEVVESLRALAPARKGQDHSRLPRWNAPAASPTVETPPLGGTPRSSIPTVNDLPPVQAPKSPWPANAAAGPGSSKPGNQPGPVAPRPIMPGARPIAPSPAKALQQSAAAPVSSRPSSPGTNPDSSHLPNLSGAQMPGPGENRVIPGGWEGPYGSSLEEKLTTIGIAAGAIVAAVLAWLIAAQLF